MRTPQKRSQRGAGLVLVILLILVSIVLTGALVSLISSTTAQSRAARVREAAYSIAEAGINRTVFQVEAAMGTPGNIQDIEAYLTGQLGPGHPGTLTYAGTVGTGTYTVTLSDPLPGDDSFQLDAVAQAPNGSPRNLIAVVHGQPVTALNYALFGNYIHFDNHNHVNWGVRLVTSVYSNSGLLIDRGISINGPAQAVQFIQPDTGPASGDLAVPDTILAPSGQQGDPNPSPAVPTAPVVQVDPAPKVQPFPSFDFAGVANTATAAGRNLTALQMTNLLNNARAFAQTLGGGNLNAAVPLPPVGPFSYDSPTPTGVSPVSVPVSVIHHNSANPNNHRKVRVPNADTPDLMVDVGSPDGVAAGPNDTYEIIFTGNPLPDNDSVLYVVDPLTITLASDTLMRLEGSLIVNGSFTLHAASEILAWQNRSAPYFVPLGSTLYDFAQNLAEVANPNKDIKYSRYPAIAANGPIKIDSSGAGNGGPAHIEGVVYSVAESHLHRSEARERAYSVGSEIADTVHNCQFFSFAYDPEAQRVLGLYIRLSGRPRLQIVRIEDR